MHRVGSARHRDNRTVAKVLRESTCFYCGTHQDHPIQARINITALAHGYSPDLLEICTKMTQLSQHNQQEITFNGTLVHFIHYNMRNTLQILVAFQSTQQNTRCAKQQDVFSRYLVFHSNLITHHGITTACASGSIAHFNRDSIGNRHGRNTTRLCVGVCFSMLIYK